MIVFVGEPAEILLTCFQYETCISKGAYDSPAQQGIWEHDWEQTRAWSVQAITRVL